MTDEENRIVRELIESADFTIWIEKLGAVARAIGEGRLRLRIPPDYDRPTDDPMWDEED